MKGGLLAVIGATTLLAACSSNRISDHMVTVGDMGNVKVTKMSSMRVNNLLVAQAYLHNSGSKAAQGYYRCQFLDANGFNVGDPQQWQLLTIYPNEDQPVKCQAIQTEATDFKIEFSNNASNVTVYK